MQSLCKSFVVLKSYIKQISLLVFEQVKRDLQRQYVTEHIGEILCCLFPA